MKVLAVTNDYPPEIGGIGRYVYELYRRLPSQGVEVRILAPDMPGASEFDAAHDLEVIRYPGRLIASTPKLSSVIKQHSSDVDVVTLGSTLPMGFSAAKSGCPLVLHTHNTEIFFDRMPGTKQMLRRLLNRISLVTVITDYTHAALAPALTNQKVLQLSPAVDLERFHPSNTGHEIRDRFDIATDCPLIVCAGRLVPRKGQDTLIKAMPLILETISDAKLLLIGSGPYESKLRKLVSALGLQDSVVFGGFVSLASLPDVFAASDVFATPCRSRFGRREVEGFGQVFLEAQAAGRPVIVGRSGGAPETTLEGVTGFVVDGEDEVATAGRIVELLADIDLRRSMGAAGRTHVESLFSWDQRAGIFASSLRSVHQDFLTV